MARAEDFRAVDRAWIDRLVLKLWRRFRGRRGLTYMHCEDAVASALAKTYCSEARDVNDLQAYVMRAASNAVLDLFKRCGERTNERTILTDHLPRSVLDSLMGETSEDDALSYLIDTADAEQLGTSLREAIASLPPKERRVFWLRARHDLTHTEIAERLTISEAACKMRLYRARKVLRTALERDTRLSGNSAWARCITTTIAAPRLHRRHHSYSTFR